MSAAAAAAAAVPSWKPLRCLWCRLLFMAISALFWLRVTTSMKYTHFSESSTARFQLRLVRGQDGDVGILLL